ncbi:hypothetical protein ABIB85_004825 [Bradyrhizobium sp. JR1.5]
MQRGLKQVLCLGDRYLTLRSIDFCPAAHGEIHGIWIRGLVHQTAPTFGLDEFNVKRASKPRRDLVLQASEIHPIAVKTIRPDVTTGRKVSKRHVHPDSISSPLHGALYRPPDAKVLAERLEIDLLIPIGESRPAPDHECIGHLREVGRQIGRNAIGEIVLLCIVVEVGEWQDNERQTGSNVGPGRSLFLRFLAFRKHVCAERLPNSPVADESARECTHGRDRGKRAADQLQPCPQANP